MLTHLKIQNFAIIENLEIDINEGMNVITGETGVGKSIILGAISLISGEKLEVKTKIKKDKKSVIEAHFMIKNIKNIKDIFIENDIDYEDETIIRREVLNNGKSRAFINDVPVSLGLLKTLKTHLIDIHSQNQTSDLINEDFQMYVLDTISNNQQNLKIFQSLLIEIKNSKKLIEQYKDKIHSIEKEQQYNKFIIKEIEDAQLKIDEQADLEDKLELLNNQKNIKEILYKCLQVINDDNIGIVNLLDSTKKSLLNIKGLKQIESITEKIENIYFEVRDIENEMEDIQNRIDLLPQNIKSIEDRLNIIYELHRKHKTNEIQDLINISNKLKDGLAKNENIQNLLLKENIKLEKLESKLQQVSEKISVNRRENVDKLSKKIENFIKNIGIPDAKIQINLSKRDRYSKNGQDDITFLFSANKNRSPMPIKNTASGGEKSRTMLAIKYIISKYYKLPCIIFDEIDTGISGRIAHKMGEVIKKMNISQVIVITHLAQIASKGNHHYKVYKITDDKSTKTTIKILNKEQRIKEIARLISGEVISKHAIQQAQELLEVK